MAHPDMSKGQRVPLANLDLELRDSRDPVAPQNGGGDNNEDEEELDTLRDLLPRGALHHKDHQARSPNSHVRFGESQSAPSSPVDKERPERIRYMTGEQARSGGRRGRQRRLSRQLSAGFHRSTHYTLGRMRHVSERTFPSVAPDDENPERGTWSSQAEFFLSCLGYAVGLGNVWRFPYLCHKNGGGAFLIPYFIMLLCCGLPILMLELSLGQYTSEGPITIWKLAPLFKGVGVGMVLISIYLAIYYNMVTGWALYYIYESLTTQLPWRCCEPGWSTAACRTTSPETCAPHNGTAGTQLNYDAGVNISARVWDLTFDVINANRTDNFVNRTEHGFDTKALRKFPSDDFFHNFVLKISDSIDKMGGMEIHLVISLCLAWTVVFLVLMRGVKSLGKTVYFTSIFPYVILCVLLIRAAIEPGAGNGIRYFLTPKWERLADAKVWGDAVTQIFFSTSICTGGVITLASYNRFKNNCFRDALVIGFGNSVTSIFSGLVVFSILGFMAEQQGAKIEDIVQGGPGLTFIIYPQAVAILPISPLWSCLFFFMLVILALSSMFPTVENITTAIIDQFTVLRPFKFWVTFVTCVTLFAFGLSLTTNGGMYLLQILDQYAVGYALIYVGLVEIFVFAYLYGAARVRTNIKQMTGIVLPIIWPIAWKFICPVLLFFCLIFTWMMDEILTYRDEPYPAWTHGFCWFLSFTSFIFVPLYAAYILVDTKFRKPHLSWGDTLHELIRPEADYGPALLENRAGLLEEGDDDVFAATALKHQLSV